MTGTVTRLGAAVAAALTAPDGSVSGAAAVVPPVPPVLAQDRTGGRWEILPATRCYRLGGGPWWKVTAVYRTADGRTARAVKRDGMTATDVETFNPEHEWRTS